VATDWRDERIAELECELARKGAELAARDARIAQLEAQVAALTKQVAELLEIVGRNSRNSPLPPSTDPPGTRGGRVSIVEESSAPTTAARGSTWRVARSFATTTPRPLAAARTHRPQ